MLLVLVFSEQPSRFRSLGSVFREQIIADPKEDILKQQHIAAPNLGRKFVMIRDDKRRLTPSSNFWWQCLEMFGCKLTESHQLELSLPWCVSA